MKKHLLKFKSWLLLLCMIVGATSSALADSYTITFSTGSGDGTTASTSTACSTIVSDGNTYLSGNLVTATKVYYGGSDGLKMGTSSAAGAIKMNLASNVTPTSIVVNAKLYNSSKAATLKVNGSTAQNISSSFSDLTFNITSEISYIQLETSKYCWIKSITVNYAAAAKDDPTITFSNGSVKVGNTLDLSTLFTSNSAGAVTYSITAGDSYASINGSTLNGVAEGEVTVKAEQAAAGNYNAGEASATITVNAIPTHTVTFSVNGAATSSVEVEEGAAIEFPDDPDDVNGKTFVGWVAEAIDGTTDDAPEFVSSANMGNIDITYYAVFALASGGGSSNVTKSYGFETESDSDWTIDGPVRTNSDANTGGYAGRINTNNTYVTFNNKVKVKEFSFAFKRTSTNSNYNVYIETSEDNSNWTAEATYAMGTFNNGTYLTKTLEFDGTQELYVRFHCYNTTAVRYVDDVTITYVSGGVSYSGYCTTVAAAIPVTSVSVDATASVNVGETTTLTATVSPDNATNKNVTWDSSDESIATVDENGVVTGVAAGEATITVTSVADGTKTAGCTVTVTTIPVTSVSVDVTASVNVGKTTTLTATVSPDNATNKNVTWESSDETIATVDENGVVTGVAAGEATITVTSVADNTKTATCTVTVSVVPGTVARPYTVAEAIDAIDASEGTTDVYVAGIVSQVDSYNSKYSSITYWISDDGTTTNQFEVYSGKGIGGADFESIDDIQVGDRVVVKGDIQKFNDIYEFNYNNQLVSREEKPASDLAKTSDIALDVKNNALTANIADHISSSSAGAYTYESADETVATVSAEGVVTGLKVGTTTITVNQAATLSYKAGTVEIPVTVVDTRVAATTIPAINISSLPSDDEGGTIEVVDPVKADEEVTFSFESSDEDVLYIEGTDYIVTGIGTATVTVTATASNSALYKNVTETFEVTVNAAEKSENVIELAFDSNSTVWGTNLEGIVGGSQGFDGTITATSSNPKVLTVAVDAEGNVTVTPVAVGSATVTFSAAETASFLAAENVQQVFTITAPAGITTAPAASGFVKVTDTEDITDGEYLIVYEDGEVAFDGSLETLDKSSNTIDVEITDGVIAATNDTKAATFTIDVTAGTIQSKSGYYIGRTANSNGMDNNTETQYTNTFEIDGDGDAVITASGSRVLQYNKTAGQTRFRYFGGTQQDIQLYKLNDPSETVTINKYGYATYCSVNPMDFSETEGYTAWYVSDITSDGVITFNKITGTIKGGQGVLLYNIDADEKTTSNVNVKFASSENELVGNLLVGTTAPTYVEETSVYGLSGDSFKKNSAAGTIGKNKAYLDANDIPNEVQAFTFVFEDDETGITETRTVSREEVESIFNLAGQRLNRTQKGINIVNGKKVFIKK